MDVQLRDFCLLYGPAPRGVGTTCCGAVKEKKVIMKRFLLVAALCALLGSFGMTQDSTQASPAQNSDPSTATMKEFSRVAKTDGLILNFVLLNNKTVDLLFSGDSKYAMRAKANMATVFYVQGASEKEITLNPKFEVVQDGKTYPGEIVNLKNFQAGPLAKGARISGLIQLSQKINVTQPFTIKGAKNASAEFELSQDAIKLLEN